MVAWGWSGPVWRLRRKMEVPEAEGPVAAFCGIARPEQFFHGLESARLRLVVRTAFPDHHRYYSGDLKRLMDTARAAGASAFVTTEKDKVRLGALASAIPTSRPLLTAGLRIEIDDEAEALQWLESRLQADLTRPSL